MKKYILEPPEYFTQDVVRFENYKGKIYEGTITWVETHYGRRDNKGFHIYSIYQKGKKYCNNVGEKNIKELLKRPEND